jgi:hypothetical protein
MRAVIHYDRSLQTLVNIPMLFNRNKNNKATKMVGGGTPMSRTGKFLEGFCFLCELIKEIAVDKNNGAPFG